MRCPQCKEEIDHSIECPDCGNCELCCQCSFEDQNPDDAPYGTDSGDE